MVTCPAQDRRRSAPMRAKGSKRGRIHVPRSVNRGEWEDATAERIIELTHQMRRACSASIDGKDSARLAVELMNKMGARFSATELPGGDLRLLNTYCPFEGPDETDLNLCACEIASNVCAGMATRDRGRTRIEFTKRLISHDTCCEILIHTDGGMTHAPEAHPCFGHAGAQGSSGEGLASAANRREGRIWRPAGQPPTAAGGSSDLEIVAASRTMQLLLEALETIGPTSATVLIAGETGVGKELAARALHATSDRANQTFVAVNCGTIPESLIESTLFGHERGAFTGAHKTSHGVFERAKGGTLLLDEIDALSLAAQTRLLRVLQEGEYERVGGHQPLRADVRLIVATNRPLEEAIEDRTFRRDLYYRINVVPLVIPPLRQRAEDVPWLVQHILQKLTKKYGKRITFVPNRVMEALMHHAWPGNVRELENVLERAFLFSTGPELQLAMPVGSNAASDPVAAELARPWNEQKKQTIARLEKQYLQTALRHWKGDVRRVAETMGLSSRAIYLKLKHYQIEPNTYRT